jgi:tRNA-2-methylthio-N6-dimethylallyladenosine synthase
MRREGTPAHDAPGKAARHSGAAQCRNRGDVQEVLVEGYNKATGQWIGRTSQHKTLNFIRPQANGDSLLGTYLDVRVTRSGPNSLAGESVN